LHNLRYIPIIISSRKNATSTAIKIIIRFSLDSAMIGKCLTEEDTLRKTDEWRGAFSAIKRRPTPQEGAWRRKIQEGRVAQRLIKTMDCNICLHEQKYVFGQRKRIVLQDDAVPEYSNEYCRKMVTSTLGMTF